jgi:hypothetical protein
MITVKQDLIITEQVYKVVCDYAKKVVLKDFILKFSFQRAILFNTKIKKKEINPLLQSLNFNQGEMVCDDLEEVNNYIYNYISQLKQSDLHALYFLTFEENYLKYSQDFEDNDGSDVRYNYNKFDTQFGRELAYKIYEPLISGLYSDLEELLKTNISNFSDELDLSEINKYSVNHILEIVDNLYS